MILSTRLTSGDDRSFLLLKCLYLLVFFFATANAAIASGVDLRIHPIGDSITDGYKSSDGNGYRNALLSKLGGNKVQYIGSSRAGSMSNSANDGYSGFEIDQISARIGTALSQRPNVVLLMASTNDINGNDNVDGAPGRLGSLLDKIISACPDAVIVLTKITPIADGGSESRAQAFNSAMDGVAQSRINYGHKIVVVDMQTSQTGLTASDLVDGLHPTDAGYAKMATVWYNAPKAGAPVSGSGQAVCHGKLFWYNNYGTIASGVGKSDPPFKSSWIDLGSVASGIGAGRGVRIADLDGDGLDDYVWVDDETGAAMLYINGGYSDGKINWQSKGQVASGLGDGAGVRFADITGDGLADYIWISKDGDIKAYINNGPKEGGGWNWAPLGSITFGLDTTAGTRASIRFADLDGDGRADLSIVGEGGSLTSWIATGRDAEPTWVSMGTTAGGIGDAAGVQLYDINGDGRADYIWVDKSSATTAYINLRAKDSLVPNWISAGKIGSGVGTGRANITFGDLTGDGKADFLIIKNSTGAIDMYENKGAGAAYQAGDQIIFADLDGDGLDDYISIGSNGALLAYRNGGANTGASNGWNWISWGTIASGVGKRHQIRMADLNGDGKADYIMVDDKTGAVTVYVNGGQNSNANLGWNWISSGKIASGIAPGKTIHFADIDGDGKADYLSVDARGGITAYLNGGANAQANLGWVWIPAGKIASGVGPGNEIRFADIDGDGKADYLLVDKATGSVTEYLNGGPNSGADGGWIWIDQGKIASGVGAAGQSIVFGAVSSRGRADYLVITPGSGAVSLWANGCDGTVGGGGDDNGGSGGGGGGGGDGGDDGDDDGYPDDYEPPFNPNYYGPCDEKYVDVITLRDNSDNVPPHCMNQYLVDAIIGMWEGALSKYRDIIADGYDDKFNSYSKYTADQVQPQINAFMFNGHADDFFDCEQFGGWVCCLECQFGCSGGCVPGADCISGGSRKITCPTDGISEDGPGFSNAKNITFTLREEADFYKAIDDVAGIQKDWIEFDDVRVTTPQGCEFSDDVNLCLKEDANWYWNYPSQGTVSVTNPKDEVEKEQSTAQDLINRLKVMRTAARYDGLSLYEDLIDSASIPAFAVVSAVDAMDAVADAADKIEEAERKEMIVDFVTGFLMLVPFAGEAAGAAGLVAARTALRLVAAAGDFGLGIYGVIDDPSSAFLAVFETLAGAGVGRGAFRNAAKTRRSMSKEDTDKLGLVKERLNQVGTARVRSCKL